MEITEAAKLLKELSKEELTRLINLAKMPAEITLKIKLEGNQLTMEQMPANS